MSDTYNYDSGAIHSDNKKVLNIGSVENCDVLKLINNFYKVDVEEAVYEEVREDASSLTALDNLGKCADDDKITGKKSFISVNGVVKSFKYQNNFVKNKIAEIIKEFYNRSAANLALIEIVLFDHNQLCKRNSHRAFVEALIIWNLLEVSEENEFNKLVSAVADKFKRMPKEGYKNWGDDHLNDKSICENIGKKLGDTMKYNR